QVLKNAAGMVVRVGLAGVFVPWILGIAAAFAFVNSMTDQNLLANVLGGSIPYPLLYSVAFGLCMAVTALPVLVVVLRELGFIQRPIGTVALSIGGVGDGLLWLSLAVLLPVATAIVPSQVADVAHGPPPHWAAAFSVAALGGVLAIVLFHYVIAPFLE